MEQRLPPSEHPKPKKPYAQARNVQKAHANAISSTASVIKPSHPPLAPPRCPNLQPGLAAKQTSSSCNWKIRNKRADHSSATRIERFARAEPFRLAIRRLGQTAVNNPIVVRRVRFDVTAIVRRAIPRLEGNRQNDQQRIHSPAKRREARLNSALHDFLNHVIRQRLLFPFEIEGIRDAIRQHRVCSKHHDRVDQGGNNHWVQPQISRRLWDVAAIVLLLEKPKAERGKHDQRRDVGKNHRNGPSIRAIHKQHRRRKRLRNEAHLVEADSVHDEFRFHGIRLNSRRHENDSKEQ